MPYPNSLSVYQTTFQNQRLSYYIANAQKFSTDNQDEVLRELSR